MARRKEPDMSQSPAAKDHRPRVAAERRKRMRRKLLESALLVFAQKGVEASVVEDVIAAAGVSRGTFYNYFDANADLLVAAIEELGNDVVDTIEARVTVLRSPAARLVTGLRLYIDTARRFPLFARFLARVGPQAIGPDSRVYKYIPIHIAEGIASGEFVEMPVRVALDMVVAAGLIAVARISTGAADPDYLLGMMLALTRSLGLEAATAEALVTEPIAPIEFDEDSLIVRSQALFREQGRLKAD
jgi:AcrR family transcriptional regulator